MSRDYDPEKGRWYEDLDREELFKVVSVDPDEILVRIQWLDGEIEDIDVDAWNELDLELAGCECLGRLDDLYGVSLPILTRWAKARGLSVWLWVPPAVAVLP